MVEIGQGSAYAIQQTIATLGANVVQVDPSAVAQMGASSGAGGKVTLTPDDCDAILHECNSVLTAAPSVDCRLQVIYGNRNWSPRNILGTTPAFLVVRNWTNLDEGEPFTDEDVRGVACVCMIGKTPAKMLFDDDSPVGKFVRVKSTRLKIVGVLSAKGANMAGVDQDDFFVAPWTTVKFRLTSLRQTTSQGIIAATSSTVNSLSQLYPNTQLALYPAQSSAQLADFPQMTRFADLDDIWVSCASADEVPVVMNGIAVLLRDRHKIREGQPDDFRIRDTAEFSKAMASSSQVMTNLLMSVALISLVVGGVGVMNIMLVSVTERTREIGLRMAVGARPRDILLQFLVEAILLCLTGGIAGIVFGRGASIAINVWLHWPTRPSALAVVASVTVSTGVGLIFGFYPAWKASRLDPIEALRYE